VALCKVCPVAASLRLARWPGRGQSVNAPSKRALRGSACAHRTILPIPACSMLLWSLNSQDERFNRVRRYRQEPGQARKLAGTGMTRTRKHRRGRAPAQLSDVGATGWVGGGRCQGWRCSSASIVVDWGPSLQFLAKRCAEGDSDARHLSRSHVHQIENPGPASKSYIQYKGSPATMSPIAKTGTAVKRLAPTV
jgi:hypothetical protein